jgi:hypothetical protein
MVRGSFATMQAENSTEVTFYYVDGQSDAYKIPIPPQQFQQQIAKFLQKPWFIFHLFDQTIMIANSRVIKIEIKPSIPQIQGEGVFANAEKITSMQRGATGRLGVRE